MHCIDGLGTRLKPDLLPPQKREGSSKLHIQATRYGVVQSHCSILSHYTLHHCLSSNRSLENGNRELENRFCYYRSCKKHFNYSILLRECAHFATGISFEIWLHHLVSCIICIPMGDNLCTLFTNTLPFLVKEVWLVRLIAPISGMPYLQNLAGFGERQAPIPRTQFYVPPPYIIPFKYHISP